MFWLQVGVLNCSLGIEMATVGREALEKRTQPGITSCLDTDPFIPHTTTECQKVGGRGSTVPGI